MPYAIALKVRDEDAPRIARVWDVLAEKGSDGKARYSEDQIRFGYPPHVTVGATNDNVDPEKIVEAVKTGTAAWKPIPATFDSIVILPRGEKLPMLARPDITAELLMANREVCAVLPPDKCIDYLLPERFQPGTTLARDIPAAKVGQAIQVIMGVWQKFTTVLDRVAIVYNSRRNDGWYVNQLWEKKLAA